MPSTAKLRSAATTGRGAQQKPAGELALIDLIRRRAALTPSRAVKLGIGDDCAILSPPPGHDLLVTTDLCLEGRHFRRDWHTPGSIGQRTLARGLSDLAAMGVQPLAAFLSLALPKSLAATTFLDGFLDGLLTLAHLHHCPLAGGDTSESPTSHVLADITLLGFAPRNTALRRSTARPGDLLYVTGHLGGAATELASLLGGNIHPRLPVLPRLAAGQALRRRKLATACIDLSDGLSTDLTHLCLASHVAAEIDAASLPLHPLTQTLTPAAALHHALHGGEDYELLFTARASQKIPRSLGGVRVSCIGRLVQPRKGRPAITLIANQHRTPLEPGGWEHFQ